MVSASLAAEQDSLDWKWRTYHNSSQSSTWTAVKLECKL
ncbi:hypothetical protein LINGRAHAP2_LOCUS2258 [Linum grandiflorum]